MQNFHVAERFATKVIKPMSCFDFFQGEQMNCTAWKSASYDELFNILYGIAYEQTRSLRLKLDTNLKRTTVESFLLWSENVFLLCNKKVIIKCPLAIKRYIYL